jgi:hypothetical protein
MKSIFRLGVLVLIAVLVAFPVMSMQAQTADKQCFGLAGGDCDLLYAAFSPDSGAQYAKGTTFDFTLDLKVKAEESADISIKGTGQVASEDDKPLFSTDLTISTNAENQEMSIPLSLRVLADKLYLNSMMITQGKWQFLPLSSAAAMGSTFGGSQADAANDPETQAAFLKAMNAPGVVKSEVKDGKAADGTATKEFTFAFDFGKFVSSPEMRAIIEKQMAENPSASDVDLDEAMPKIAEALKDTVFNLTFQVGTDKLLHGLGVHLAMKMDEATLKELQELGGSSMSTGMEGDLDLDVTFQLDLSKIGTAPTIEEPEDAEELDLSGLFGGMPGSN